MAIPDKGMDLAGKQVDAGQQATSRCACIHARARRSRAGRAQRQVRSSRVAPETSMPCLPPRPGISTESRWSRVVHVTPIRSSWGCPSSQACRDPSWCSIMPRTGRRGRFSRMYDRFLAGAPDRLHAASASSRCNPNSSCAVAHVARKSVST